MPQGARRIHASQNTVPHEEQRHLGTPLDIREGGENSWTREHDPYRPTSDGHNGEAQGRNDEGDNLVPCQPEKGAQSWEQRFRGIQQELDLIKEVVKGWALVSMDDLVQQKESLFTIEVLHLPLPTKFKMPQIESFDGTKDPVDHLNTYKNQMELHGY